MQKYDSGHFLELVGDMDGDGGDDDLPSLSSYSFGIPPGLATSRASFLVLGSEA